MPQKKSALGCQQLGPPYYYYLKAEIITRSMRVFDVDVEIPNATVFVGSARLFVEAYGTMAPRVSNDNLGCWVPEGLQRYEVADAQAPYCIMPPGPSKKEVDGGYFTEAWQMDPGENPICPWIFLGFSLDAHGFFLDFP